MTIPSSIYNIIILKELEILYFVLDKKQKMNNVNQIIMIYIIFSNRKFSLFPLIFQTRSMGNNNFHVLCQSPPLLTLFVSIFCGCELNLDFPFYILIFKLAPKVFPHFAEFSKKRVRVSGRVSQRHQRSEGGLVIEH